MVDVKDMIMRDIEREIKYKIAHFLFFFYDNFDLKFQNPKWTVLEESKSFILKQ